jgi:hypothetical protein
VLTHADVRNIAVKQMINASSKRLPLPECFAWRGHEWRTKRLTPVCDALRRQSGDL